MESVGIIGTGLYVPEHIRSNEWFNQFPLLPFDDIFDDSGIKERRICGPNETGVDMEVNALKNAVHNAGIEITDIDLILDGPTIQDQPMPGNAASVQYKSGAVNAAAINVDTSCTTLLSQITIGQSLIQTGTYKNIACIASANWTKVADYSEKNCMLLGDGATAVILSKVKEGHGILSTYLETDGRGYDAIGCNLRLPRNLTESYEPGNYLHGNREKVYFYVKRHGEGLEQIKKSGPKKAPEAARKALHKAGYKESDLDFLICHNPTKVLVEAWLNELKVPGQKTHTTLAEYGNMSGVSLGANLHEAATEGKIKDGDLVAICAPGAGHHHAAVVMRWGK